ncbi:hypothetical protein HYFRA_00001736 [Hymenoscyphus fraxineus]|uniref:2EXR domain-containing protein n=1 Tax=Hymenoscyphus fraxineus TaxID=746836 RepID=A0A9N9PYC6_9HELO|nr:hypothetical protein HYFRA_00001736 [Hymenoscyphus fraxineus]
MSRKQQSRPRTFLPSTPTPTPIPSPSPSPHLRKLLIKGSRTTDHTSRRYVQHADHQKIKAQGTHPKLHITNQCAYAGPRQPPRNIRVAPTSFHPFGRLPLELRLDIWQHALPGPRIVDLKTQVAPSHIGSTRVRSDKAITTSSSNTQTAIAVPDVPEFSMDDIFDASIRPRDRHSRYGFRTDCPAPVLLYVCRESYAVVAKFYTPMFNTPNVYATIWFDPTIDTLLINDETFARSNRSYNIYRGDWVEIGHFNLINKSHLNKVEKLCINPDFLPYPHCPIFSDDGPRLGDILNCFPSVKSVTFASEQARQRKWIDETTLAPKPALAFLSIEDYYLALARLAFKSTSEIELKLVPRVNSKSFMVRLLAWISTPGGSFVRDYKAVRFDARTIVTETLKEQLLRNVDFQRPVTKDEAIMIARKRARLGDDFTEYPLMNEELTSEVKKREMDERFGENWNIEPDKALNKDLEDDSSEELGDELFVALEDEADEDSDGELDGHQDI